MTRFTIRATVGISLLVAALAGGIALCWDTKIAAGILAGVAWNLVNLWCLVGLLTMWLGTSPQGPEADPQPSKWRRRLVRGGWLLVKFPLLYGVLFVVFSTQIVSYLGFGIGFLSVLLVAMGVSIRDMQRMVGAAPVDGS